MNFAETPPHPIGLPRQGATAGEAPEAVNVPRREGAGQLRSPLIHLYSLCTSVVVGRHARGKLGRTLSCHGFVYELSKFGVGRRDRLEYAVAFDVHEQTVPGLSP